jgi:hypothetical protein
MKTMGRSFLYMSLAAALVLGGCHSSQQAANPDNSQQNAASTTPGQPAGSAPATPRQPAPPPPPAVAVIPSGSQIRVRLDQDLGSKISQPGDTFTATVADDVTANGTVIIPQGARADGTVVNAAPLGRFKGGALLAIRLDRVHTRWGSYPVATGTIDKVEKGKGKRSAAFIGGGAGLGALIGGLAGGGKGALIGALAGGGAGTAGSAFTGNKQIVLPAETLVTFHLDRSVHVTEAGGSGDPQLQQR